MRVIVFTKFPSPYWGPSFRSVIAEVAADGKGKPVTLVGDQGANDFAYASNGRAWAFLRVRNLVNTPTEDMGPEQLEAVAREIAGNHGAMGRSVEEESIRRLRAQMQLSAADRQAVRMA